jgi:uncharacterized membrane-anchored protein
MKRVILVLSALGVFGLLGREVVEAEALIRGGDVVLLELAPVDPRSLIQGDYMRLSWAVEREASDALDGRRVAVLAIDGRGVARFRRLHDGGALAGDERLFEISGQASRNRLVVEPHSFLFQEGRSDDFARAKYGVFRVAATGRHLLVGLAGADGVPIGPR